MRRMGIEEMQKIARDRRGMCLSEKYIDNSTKLKWQCEEGHKWEARPYHIKNRNQWCPICAGVVKLTIEEMQKIAEKKVGKCLSREYINSHTKLKWQCNKGHIWESIPKNIKSGSWCPYCSQGVSERICRGYFEIIFNNKFPKKRPKWLKGNNNLSLELDGYCKGLKLAFEYNGEQHYVHHKFFCRSLQQTKQYDILKINLCERKGVALIEVPHTVSFKNMGEYIIEQCREKGINVPSQTKLNSFDYKLFDVYSVNKLKGMQELAESKGGKCLSIEYVNYNTKLTWQCNKGHIWEAIPSRMKIGKWCPECAGNKRLTINEMQEIAKSKGGKCLSTKYVNCDTKLKWQCSKGHIWQAKPNNIKHGRWCHICLINTETNNPNRGGKIIIG